MRRVAVFMALAVAACAQTSEPVEQSSGSAGIGAYVTYRYGSDVGEAHAHAATYCGKFRRRAWLRGTSTQDGTNLATFDCR